MLYLCGEEAIHDLISVSDLWTCFESTTALESWLMNKQTIFINPDPDFNRDLLYKGSPLVKSYQEFQTMIDEFYSSGKVVSFFNSEKETQRKELIKSIIGFGDGFNHIRASKYFAQNVYKSKVQNPKSKFHFWHWLVFVLIRVAAPFYSRKIFSKLYKLKKHLWVFENYKMEKLHKLYAKYVPSFEEFYSKQGIEQKFKDGTLFETYK